MPAILDDPATPTIHRVSGALPYPDPNHPTLPENIRPRQVTLRDRKTVATVVPFVSHEHVPPSLLRHLSDELAKEIERGDTYPMSEPMPYEAFVHYWFQNFAGIMLLGHFNSADEIVEGKDWSQLCLGSFYIKPNYPGRSSHVCNGGFLVTDAARNRGVGRLMGEAYLDWAPKSGYTYSVFNLVYETNVASCKIWDGLGFKRIGRVKGCGNLRSHPGRLVDAIIYGRDLSVENSEGSDPPSVSEERFDKIKFYLKHARYPDGADRAEKSRLRSAATHYKIEAGVLKLKGKEVISDPVDQMAVARRFHKESGHAGINKTTSVIAEKYHWSRIKETVSDVIRGCEQCKDLGRNNSSSSSAAQQQQNKNQIQSLPPVPPLTPLHQDHHQTHDQDQHHSESAAQSGICSSTPGDLLGSHTPSLHDHLNTAALPRAFVLPHDAHDAHHDDLTSHLVTHPNSYGHPTDITSLLNPPPYPAPPSHIFSSHHPLLLDRGPTLASIHDSDLYHPLNPHLLSRGPTHAAHHHSDAFGPFHPRFHQTHSPTPSMTHASLQGTHHDLTYPHTLHTHHTDTESFQALLSGDVHDQDAVDRDIALLIEHPSPDFRVSSSSTPSLRGMEIDDLDLETGGYEERRKNDSSGGRRRHTSPDVAGAAKRSDIYNVVFNVP